MKVGILTFHRADNYGAVLQCYALQQTILKLGHEVSVIDYRQPFIEGWYSKCMRTFGVKHFLKISLKEKLPYLFERLSYDIKTRFIEHPLRRKEFTKFRDKFLNLTCPCNDDVPKGFDVFVIGSDMLWARECMGGQLDYVYWGDFKHRESSRIVGYAISTTPASMDFCNEHDVFRKLGNFTSLSLRESVIAEFIKEKTGMEYPVCIDPTLLLDADAWNPLIKKEWSKRKYILTYYLRVPFNKRKEIRKRLEKLAEETDCEIIDIDKNFGRVTVEDFVSLIKFAQYMVTDSFHGVVFSVIFGRPVHSIRHYNPMDTRSVDLLSYLQIPQALSDMNIDPEIVGIDYEAVQKRLSCLRVGSLNYLKENL